MAEFRVHKAADVPGGTSFRDLYQTGFCQESTVTADNLPSPLWGFQKDASEAAGPQTKALLDGNRKAAALSGLSHCCRALHHEALWGATPNKADPRCTMNGFMKAMLCAPAWVTTKYAAVSALSPSTFRACCYPKSSLFRSSPSAFPSPNPYLRGKELNIMLVLKFLEGEKKIKENILLDFLCLRMEMKLLSKIHIDILQFEATQCSFNLHSRLNYLNLMVFFNCGLQLFKMLLTFRSYLVK